jgi:probable rRNA maturation factor
VNPIVDITLEAEGWSTISGAETLARRAALAALASAGIAEGEISLLLTDDAQVRELNSRFRGKDKPTNVLSFPSNESNDGVRFLGDIAIAFETVEREARAEGKTLEANLSHLVVHGVLHLLGFDHENDRDAEKMERLETEILATLGFADPYAVPAEV